MRINTTTGNSIARLLSKSIGQNTEYGAKIICQNGGSIFAPMIAETYDVMSGIGKKGAFELFSFKDGCGNVIQLYTRYLKGNNKYTDVITDLDKTSNITNITRTTINGILSHPRLRSVQKIEYISILQNSNKKSFLKSYMTRTPNGDFGGWDVLKPSKKASGIKFDYSWFGEPKAIEHKNTNGLKLDLTTEERQYLPFLPRKFINSNPHCLDTDFAPDYLQRRINLSQIIQERLHGIKENVLPRARGVQSDNMLIVRNTGMTASELKAKTGMFYNGEAQATGQINLAIDIPKGKDSLEILARMAHEMQHEDEYIKSYCGGKDALIDALKDLGINSDEAIKNHVDYFIGRNLPIFNRCIEKIGLYIKGTPEYKEAVRFWKERLSYNHNYKNKEEHDIINWEQRAIKREKEETAFIKQIITKIDNFISQL